MTPGKSLRALFEEALERPDAAARARFLDDACGADAALRARLEKLLRAHDDAGGFLSRPSEKPPGADSPGDAPALLLTEKPGDKIGHYKLLQQIGEGGCGVVYMAEQEEPVRRHVALKIIKLGMDTKQVVARFEAERQALALMDHPNIARVLDAGSTDSGRPYFVMELVRGVKITGFCDGKKLSARERLELFLQVCSAIQHAHQKGIIHRDLKPSNLLITTVDGAPVSKVIDFGIAKATTNQRLTDKTLFTAFQQFIGTPAYMSPEQAEMSGVDIDTRSDIYSLGVVLYELLTGQTPFDSEQLLRSGIDEIRRTIREREPSKPSTRLSTLAGDEASTVAEARTSQIPLLVKAVRGDLDWIVMKCLEKDRGRRYATANALAMEIRRHLEGEPIMARPPSNLYRLHKLVGRHRTVSVLSAILLLSLFVGGVMLWRSERQLRRSLAAEQKSHTAEMEVLHSSLIGQARAVRQSRRIGQRFEALALLQQAAKLKLTTEVRNEAVAALGNFDLLPIEHRPLPPIPITISSTYSSLTLDAALGVMVCQEAGRGWEIRQLDGSGRTRSIPKTQDAEASRFELSRDGRWFVAGLRDQIQVWSLDGDHPAIRWTFSRHVTPESFWLLPVTIAFRSDSGALAVAADNGSVEILNLRDKNRRTVVPPGSPIVALEFDPSGSRIALIHRDSVEILDLKTGQVAASIPLPDSVPRCAWSPDGELLAVASTSRHSIEIKSAATGETVITLEIPTAPDRFAFHPDGRIFAAVSEHRRVWLWELPGTQPVLSFEGHDRVLQFSADGQRLAVATFANELAILEVASSPVFREFQSRHASRRVQGRYVDTSPDGRLVATADAAGLRVWDAPAGRELFGVPQPKSLWSFVLFHPDGRSLLSSLVDDSLAIQGCFRWELTWHSSPTGGRTVELGPREIIGGKTDFLMGFTPAGSWIISGTGADNGAYLWPGGDPAKRRKYAERNDNGASMPNLSPDEKYAAIYVSPGQVQLWSAADARLIKSLPGGPFTQACFTRDGRWLVTGTEHELQLWETGTWRFVRTLATGLQRQDFADLFFSPDGKLMIFQASEERFQIRSLPDFDELMTLEAPLPLARACTEWSKDGQKFYILSADNRLFEWNLVALREELTKRGLGWTSTK